MDSAVHIRIGKQRKSTGVRRSTDSPYFNEYFVFEFNTTFQALMDKHLTLTIIQPRKIWRSRKILGYFNLDIASVWAQPDHLFFHKWAVITAALCDHTPGPRGYVKMDIAVLAKGEVPRFPLSTDYKDDVIEGNLLLPEGYTYERQRANFIFKIYRGENISKLKTNIMRRSILTESDQLPSTHVQITFAGLVAKTSIRKNTQNPVWNERITLTELFPPLCQRIKIELKYAQNSVGISHYINLKSISNDRENGFLPTFGPAYIHLYGSEEEYCGKLLIEINTEILDDLIWATNSVEIKPIRQMPDLSVWRSETLVLLFCTIYSATMIDKKYKDKQISIAIAMGNSTSENGNSKTNISIPLKARSERQFYWYLPFNENKPCLSIVSSWPDARRRIYDSNMIQKMHNRLKEDLEGIEHFFEIGNYKEHKEEIDNVFQKAVKKLETNCRVYAKISKSEEWTKTMLDEKIMQMRISEIDDIERSLSKTTYFKNRKRTFRKLKTVLDKLHNLIGDAQDCWPDILLWMKCDGKKVAICRLPVKNIIFSETVEERGHLCSVLQNVYLKAANAPQILFADSRVATKLVIQMWVGLESQKQYCFKMFPPSFHPPENSKANTIPTVLTCEEKHLFECKVHLYQGRFIPGADDSGLADPFIRITIDEGAIPKTIHPTWDQTLTYSNIILYGSVDFIMSNRPLVVMEAFDQDKCINVTHEFIGRASFYPYVKLVGDTSKSTLALHWYKVIRFNETVGKILVAAELIELVDDKIPSKFKSPRTEGIQSIPSGIRPDVKSYRLDVYFWGVRDLKKIGLCNIYKPKITIECGGCTIHSTVIQNTKRNPNFIRPYKFIEITIPDQQEYYPPLSIKMFDCRGFGWHNYAGTFLGDIQEYIYYPLTCAERTQLFLEGKPISSVETESSSTVTDQLTEPKFIERNKKIKNDDTKFNRQKFGNKISGLFGGLKNNVRKFSVGVRKGSKVEESKSYKHNAKSELDIESMDWWNKFYLSLKDSQKIGNKDVGLGQTLESFRLKIYNSELENHAEFKHFNDRIKSFHIYRGKRTGDDVLDEGNIIGVFKGVVHIYPVLPDNEEEDEYVTITGLPLRDGIFQSFPANEPFGFAVKIYIVRGINLRPKDLSGSSDPYIQIKMGGKTITDSDNYVPNQVNPVFGRCYELNGLLPFDHSVTVSVWDRDIGSTDDLIGETKISLEERIYTKHRATCGIPNEYYVTGNCAWRDQTKPSQILQRLCKRWRVDDSPQYTKNSVKVGGCIFTSATINGDEQYGKEVLSLIALRRWKEVPLVGCTLVPEHVETRSLYHPDKTGLEQGKLQLWVDIFPSMDVPPPLPVDIAPRQPIPYELRVVVWNTEDVILQEDDFFIGEKKSDIYVKGWLIGPESSQCTDVHYNSISGEGNFNWRFVFPFHYLAAENKFVVRRKHSVFSMDATEMKLPCRLTLQVWDNDTFSADDFLGALILELAKLPRGAKSSKSCKLDILEDKAPTVNIFKIKRHKGWWPFRNKNPKTNKYELTGKIEAEFQLLTEDEARESPAGIGRQSPQGLPEPKRPDMSFSWFRSPLKALKFIVCKRFRCQIIWCFFFFALIAMVLVAIYAFPNYLVKKILNA